MQGGWRKWLSCFPVTPPAPQEPKSSEPKSPEITPIVHEIRLEPIPAPIGKLPAVRSELWAVLLCAVGFAAYLHGPRTPPSPTPTLVGTVFLVLVAAAVWLHGNEGKAAMVSSRPRRKKRKSRDDVSRLDRIMTSDMKTRAQRRSRDRLLEQSVANSGVSSGLG
jgi:hypothetical protein